jgi:hypothetical protein
LSGYLNAALHGTVPGSDQNNSVRKISPPTTPRRDSCCRCQNSRSWWMDNLSGKRISAAGELEVTPVTHRGLPFCFAAGADMLAGELPSLGLALRVCTFPPHRRSLPSLSVARRSNCHGTGHPAAAPVPSSSSDRLAPPLKFPATARSPYKLKPPPAPQGHHPPRHQESLATVHLRARISNSTQISSPPPRNPLHRGQPFSGQFILPSFSFGYSHNPVMLAEPPN